MFKLNQRSLLFCIALAGTALLSHNALADSKSVNGTSPSAAVNLNFKVTIPSVLRFRVGTDVEGTVDEVLFGPTAAVLGSGTDVVATTNGTVTTSLFSNAGAITITPTNNGAGTGMDNGFGDFIPYSEILTSESNAAFANPVLSNGGGTATTPTPTSGNNKITNYPSETWSYTYDNTSMYPKGDYVGTVTYTATTP